VRLPDRRGVWHALGSAVALLCLALPNAAPGASARTTQQARPLESSATAFAQPSMPMATDRMPCVRSCLAPVPSAQSLGAECPPPDEPPSRFLASPVDAAWRFDTGGGHARLPLRLAYCRWLN